MERLDARALAARGLQVLHVFADQGDGLDFRGIERQLVLVVLEQHHALLGDVPRNRLVFRRVDRAGLAAGVEHVRGEHHVEIAAHLVVQQRHWVGAAGHAVAKRLAEVKGVVVKVGAGARAHFEVEAVGRAAVRGVRRAPVRHDKALETPVLFQDLVEQVIIFRAIRAVDFIVGRHDGERAALLDRGLEGRQVNLAQRALVHVDVDAAALGLLVVGGEVLHARRQCRTTARHG